MPSRCLRWLYRKDVSRFPFPVEWNGKRTTGNGKRVFMTWKEKYKSLTRFISQNPEIVISANEISIPQNLREEFYALFDKIRVSLVETY